MDKCSFTRKEIAFLIDALRIIQNLDSDTKREYGMTDKRLTVMLFKLWRVFDAFERGIVC